MCLQTQFLCLAIKENYFLLTVFLYVLTFSTYFLTITMGLCPIASSISQLTHQLRLNLAAISQTVAPEPGPRALSAMLVIFSASLAERLQPAIVSGVELFLSLKNLPAR
jgi:hypothetical protein